MPHYRWNRTPKRLYITEPERIDQAEQAKAYQVRVLSKESELYTAYWRAMEQGYKPNITKYLQ